MYGRTRPRLFISACIAFLAAIPFPQAQQISAKKPVSIQGSISLTGPYAETGRMMFAGYKLWEKETNERGGLLGRPVSVTIEDDQSSPDKAKAIYQRIIKSKTADLILSPYGTPITLAASEVTEAAGYVMIVSGAAAEQIWNRGFRYVFGVYAPARHFFFGFLDLVAREGFETLTLIYENNTFHREIAEGSREWARKFGIKIVSSIEFDPLTQDFVKLASAVSNGRADCLIVSAYPDAGYAFLKALTASRYRPAAFGMDILPIHPQFLENAGAIGQGILAPSQWEPMERLPFPGTTDFIRNFQQTSGTEPSYHAVSAYASCQILEKAVRAVGGFDGKTLREYIASLDTVTVFGRFKVDLSGLQIGHNTITIQWQNGQKEIVYPPHMRTSLPRF